MSSKQQRHMVIPAVYLVFRRGREVLLLKRANTGYMDDMYSLPAGHVDGGETALEAVIREGNEEVAVSLAGKDLELVHTLHRLTDDKDSTGRRFERIDMFFEVVRWQGEPVNNEPLKCDELRWVDSNALPANMVPEVKFVLEKIAAGQHYSDFNFDLR